MFAGFLLICVIGVAGLVLVGVVRDDMRKRREKRERRALARERIEAAQLKAQQLAATMAALKKPVGTVVPLMKGELTGVITKLDQSAGFVKQPAEPTAPVARTPRMAKGSVPPPIAPDMRIPHPGPPAPLRSASVPARPPIPPPLPRRAR